MGWTDSLAGNIGQDIDPGNLLGIGGVKKQTSGIPGVGGPMQGGQAGLDANGNQINRSLQPQPDGTFVDPATGTRYADAIGQVPIAAPNTAQQVAGATTNSQDFLNRNGVQDQRGAAAYNGQKAFEGDLTNVIRNPNAPTVSTAVMDQALGNIDRNQLSSIAGSGGANAAAARKQAFMNMGNQDVQAAGQGAIARATEAAGARTALGNTLQQEAGNANDATGQNIQGAGAFANLGMQGSVANQNALDEQAKINAGVDTGNMQQKQGFLGGAAGGGMKAFA